MSSSGDPCDAVSEISAAAIRDWLTQRGRAVTLVDVRQPAEYVMGHIPGSVLIPLGQIAERVREIPSASEVVTVCRSGSRSMAAARILCLAGRTPIYSLAGGMLAWPYEVVRGGTPLSPADSSSVLTVLDAAVRSELEAAAWYLAASVDAPEGTRALLLRLADEELGHWRSLVDRRAALLGEDRSVDEPMLPAVAGDAVPSDPVQILERAVNWELQAYERYGTAAVSAASADVRDLLTQLAALERAHAAVLLERLAIVASQADGDVRTRVRP